jgi:hypothetical protein
MMELRAGAHYFGTNSLFLEQTRKRASNANLTSLQTYHKLGFFDLANGASAVPTRQQKQQQWARI